MSRNQKVTKQNIINASFEILKKEGFEQFTARRIAKSLHSSTQPIYKEFDSMGDLKESLVVHIQNFLEREVFRINESSNQLLEICSNYIYFAHSESVLFSAIFLDRELRADLFHNCSYSVLDRTIQEDRDFPEMSKLEREKVSHVIWSSIHGLAVLIVQGKIEYKKIEWNKLINHILRNSITIVNA